MSLRLGIDDSHGFVFEGGSHYGGHLLYPPPVVTPAKFVDATTFNYSPLEAKPGTSYVFREDTFDAVSRIRRGRFYRCDGSTKDWQVQPHPIVKIVHCGYDPGSGLYRTSALTEGHVCRISGEFGDRGTLDIAVFLGTGKTSTIWSIVGIESIFTGEELVTLKARQSFGALPRVSWGKVPPQFKSSIQEKLSLLEDEFHRAGAESVVDQARETATAILSAYLIQEGHSEAHGKDLGDLVALLEKKVGRHAKRIVACAAEIPQRLHSRRKTSEQQKRDLRPIREQDAQLAVQCVGAMLCDLEWAEWS